MGLIQKSNPVKQLSYVVTVNDILNAIVLTFSSISNLFQMIWIPDNLAAGGTCITVEYLAIDQSWNTYDSWQSSPSSDNVFPTGTPQSVFPPVFRFRVTHVPISGSAEIIVNYI